MRTDGMVIVGSTPDMPAGGLPATLSAMSTAVAPAFWAFFTLTAKPQVPRSRRAILPVRLVVMAEQPSVVEGPAASAGSRARATVPVTPGAGGKGPKVAVPTRKAPSAAGARTVTSGV